MLFGYSDADSAHDIEEQKSQTGYLHVLNGAAVSWKSERQQTTALSTMEAQYMALTAASQVALFSSLFQREWDRSDESNYSL